MRDLNSKKSKLSWSKSLVRKWFNIKSKNQDFHADDFVDREQRSSFSEIETSTVKKSRTDRSLKTNSNQVRYDTPHVTDTQHYSIFTATWNVGGKSPPSYLSLDDWLHSSPPADIYVLGFQEIVPLNAGNILGTEDNAPARKWVSLIRKTLNNLPGSNYSCSYHTPSPVPDPLVELDADFEGSSTRQNNYSFFHRHSFQSFNRSEFMTQPRCDRRYSTCERVSFGSRPSDCDLSYQCGGSSDDEYIDERSYCESYNSPISCGYGVPQVINEHEKANSRYCLVASKQMVGIFLTIWVRREIRDDVKNLKVSCVGRGLMGYLGNKGSISISMTLHQTSFCFICTHLTSGQKEGDELRRNSDVMEILRKTRFPRVSGINDDKCPQTILDHHRVIWLGDLNYRIALSYRSAKSLVEMHNWRALLEKDQLRIEQRYGRVFNGWNEGRIYFPPTYKYSNNSDRYTGDDVYLKEKRRTPAWCDRILWYGRGLNQISYVRGESRFSDHRPVCSIFTAEVELINSCKIKRSTNYTSSRIEVEELLPYSQGYTEYGYFCN